MIVAERKPLDELKRSVAGRKKILVLGCGGCVTVCVTGGEKQVELLASQLRMSLDGVEVKERTITRQCDREFLDEIADDVAEADAVLSMACGAGVQLVSERFPETRILPAMNTTFLGANVAPGIWSENCRGCGNCRLGETAGICPITRCTKGLINGACGGTNNGKCEVSDEIDCGWYLIYKRLKELDRLDELREMRDPVDWSISTSGAPRLMVLDELTEEPEEEPTADKA